MGNLFSSAPDLGHFFMGNRGLLVKYDLSSNELNKDNLAKKFIDKILLQNDNLDDKIFNLNSLKSTLQGIPFKNHIKKGNISFDAKMIIKQELLKYEEEIDKAIETLKQEKLAKNQFSQNAGINPVNSSANAVAISESYDPAIITTTPNVNLKVNSKTNLPSITQNINPANSVGNPSQIKAAEEKKNTVITPNSSIKYNIKNDTDIYKIYHEINKILDLLSRQIIVNIRNKYTKNIKLYEIEPNDVKDFIKLLLIFRILINPETLKKDYKQILITIDPKSKKIVTRINPHEDIISSIRNINQGIIITNSDNEIVKKYKEFIFDRNTDDKEIKKLIKSFKTELIKQNNVKLKQEFNIIISKLLSSYPLIIPGYKKPEKTTKFPKYDPKRHEQETLNSLTRQFKIYENNKKNIIIPQNIKNEINNNNNNSDP